MNLPCSYALSTEGSLVLCGQAVWVSGPGRVLCDRHEIEDSFIYFVRYNDHVKIGWTVRPATRLREIMSGGGCVTPPKLSGHAALLALVRGDRRTEQLLHTIFAKYRDTGEWFRIEGHLATFLSTLDPSAKDIVRAMVDTRDQADDPPEEFSSSTAVGLVDF